MPKMKKFLHVLVASITLGSIGHFPVAEAAPATTPGDSSAVLPADEAEAGVTIATARLIHDCLVQLHDKSSDADTQYYEDGLWHFSKEKGSEGRMSGPARAAATLWVWQAAAIAKGVLPATLQAQATPEKQEWLHRIAVDTFNRLIKDFQSPKGYFEEEATPSTYFFAVELASTYLVLKDSLDDQTRRLWLDTLTGEVNYMTARGDLPNLEKGVGGWYTNGNIELGEAELLYKTWRATGDQKYQRLFEAQWSHTLEPKEARWQAFGLAYNTQPTHEDGSDGSAYLKESGGAAPGYDGSYTGVQLDVATSLYVASRDPRALRLMNLLLNTMLLHVDQATWTSDVTGGTRKNYKGMFMSPALAIAAYHGHRDELRPGVRAQFDKAIKGQFWGAAVQNWNHPNMYLGMGTEVAVLLEASLPKTSGK